MQSHSIPVLKKNVFRSFEKQVRDRLYKPLVRWYTGRERPYRYKDSKITVHPGVFHPGFFFTTRILLEFLEFVNMKRKRVLEIGAGSGMISIVAAKEGGYVTATDLDSKAVLNLRINRDRNLQGIEKAHGVLDVVQSDLFDHLTRKVYDIIIVNPVLFHGYPLNTGKGEVDYFERLFSGLSHFIHNETEVFIILSDDCDLDQMGRIALKNNFRLACEMTRKNLADIHFIFRISINQ